MTKRPTGDSCPDRDVAAGDIAKLKAVELQTLTAIMQLVSELERSEGGALSAGTPSGPPDSSLPTYCFDHTRIREGLLCLLKLHRHHR